MILEDELVGPTTALEEEYGPSFEAKAAVALDNANIQVDKQLRAARTQLDTVPIMVAQPHPSTHTRHNWTRRRKIPNTISQECTWEPTI